MVKKKYTSEEEGLVLLKGKSTSDIDGEMNCATVGKTGM